MKFQSLNGPPKLNMPSEMWLSLQMHWKQKVTKLSSSILAIQSHTLDCQHQITWFGLSKIVWDEEKLDIRHLTGCQCYAQRLQQTNNTRAGIVRLTMSMFAMVSPKRCKLSLQPLWRLEPKYSPRAHTIHLTWPTRNYSALKQLNID